MLTVAAAVIGTILATGSVIGFLWSQVWSRSAPPISIYVAFAIGLLLILASVLL